MLNLTKEGRPFAKVIGGKYNNQVIRVSEKSNEGFKYLGIANDATFQLIPSPKTEREILHATGPSGSSKSTLERTYL